MTSRRQAILDAALVCFTEAGYDQTTLADIRQAANASTGSIYHHFGSKEQIAASLYLDAVASTQQAGLEALLKARTGRTGVHALVGAYLDWVEAHPGHARFLLWMRHADFLVTRNSGNASNSGSAGDAGHPRPEQQLDDLNADVARRTADWFAARIAAGELPDIDPGLRRALIFGPCRHWASRWLADETQLTVTQAKRQLAPAVYASLMSLA
jgi:AcrR family transcriptional regulator